MVEQTLSKTDPLRTAMSETLAPATEPQEFDIQHDDEFEDFKKIEGDKAPEGQGDWLDDWDDDVVENFSEILKEQRLAVGGK